MTSHKDAGNPSKLREPGTEGYTAPVSAKVRVDTDQADLFRRNKNDTTSPTHRSTNCPLIPTSGTLA